MFNKIITQNLPETTVYLTCSDSTLKFMLFMVKITKSCKKNNINIHEMRILHIFDAYEMTFFRIFSSKLLENLVNMMKTHATLSLKIQLCRDTS